MIVAPTAQQLHVLRMLGAGGKLHLPGFGCAERSTVAALVVNRVQVSIVRTKTLNAFVANGWIDVREEALGTLSDIGQRLVDSHAFVRAFCDNPEAH